MKPVRIRVNHMRDGFGIDFSHQPVTLSWNVVGGRKQQAYRVQVEGSLGSRFDSGIVKSSDMSMRIPIVFKAREKVLATVYCMDEIASISRQESEANQFLEKMEKWCSDSIQFEVALAEDDWEADWINPEIEVAPAEMFSKQQDTPRRPASYLMKRVKIEDPFEVARLYITARGLYSVWINGKHVEGFEMAPGTSRYLESMPFQIYDVSAYLKVGENEIVVVVSDGWWRGTVTYDGVSNTFGSTIALLAQIEIDGKIVGKTDKTWKASQNGALRYADNMYGEIYDARMETITDWHEVRNEEFTKKNLCGRILPPPICHETFLPTLLITPEGDSVLDFGQNIAGVVSFELEGKEGECYKFIHGETLDDSGNFSIEHFQSMNFRCDQEIIYYPKDGKNSFRPYHTFMGFQYVKVEGMKEIDPNQFLAHAIYTDLEVTAEFQCGNKLVNQLFQNSMWSLKGNLLDAPTDCPTREKSAFSGDFQAYSHTFLYMMDGYSMIEKFMECQNAGQFEDGCVRQIVCDAMKRSDIDGAAGWSNSFEILPLRLWERYNDISVAEKFYPSIKKWIDYCLKKAASATKASHEENPYKEYLYDTGFHWGEWLEPGMDFLSYMKDIIENGKPEEATAYLAQGCEILANFARTLGKQTEAEFYQNKSELVKKAYRFLCMKEGKIDSNRMCHYVRPIALNLLSEQDKKETAKNLNKLVKSNEYHLNTGFLTTHELCRTLSDYGYADSAYHLLLQEEYPGWLYSVKCGATTIPEAWNAFLPNGGRKDSFNHYSYGAISGWLMDSCLGIRVKYGKITIEPKTEERLGFAEGSYLSNLGKIYSSWKYNDGKDTITYEIEIPENTVAEFIGQDGYKQVLEAGRTVIEVKSILQKF